MFHAAVTPFMWQWKSLTRLLTTSFTRSYTLCRIVRSATLRYFSFCFPENSTKLQASVLLLLLVGTQSLGVVASWVGEKSLIFYSPCLLTSPPPQIQMWNNQKIVVSWDWTFWLWSRWTTLWLKDNSCYMTVFFKTQYTFIAIVKGRCLIWLQWRCCQTEYEIKAVSPEDAFVPQPLAT